MEDAFRTLKNTLELRPLYHRLEDRIRTHVLLCWLALLLVRVVENKTGWTWRKVRRHLERIHAIELGNEAGRVVQRTELTGTQKQLFKLLDIKEPPKILDFQPRGKVRIQ
ncbi:MAG: IS4-like transposase [Clostridia bacterium 62_21]|nr:MAG: IS4-like transposase [Clostridia bacterium 62_21]